jgi:acyl carrier protein
MEELKTFIQNEVMNLAFVKVGFDDSIIFSNVLDSISVVELLVAIEEKIGQKFPQHLVQEENFDTINKMIETVSKISND